LRNSRRQRPATSLQRTLKKAAQPLLESMGDRAPRLNRHASSVGYNGAKFKAHRASEAGRRSARASTSPRYTSARPIQRDMFQEFGTFKDAAQPWAAPAWEETKDGALETIKTGLGNEIEKSAARLAKKAGKL
jgi:hypothetical protein